MWDVFFKALRSPLDYLGAIYTRTLILREIIQESEHIYSFIFEPKRMFTWQSGEHGVFWFPGVRIEGRDWRAFSLASSSHEQVIRVTTIISDDRSDFKQKLRALQPGDTIRMHGPFGEFHTHKNTKNIVGIAGGIGITPFRALLYDIAHGHLQGIDIMLIYAATNNLYTFRKELDEFAKSPHIAITYVETPEEVNAALDAEIAKNGNAAEYFISGSPGMIGALRGVCKKRGLSKIVHDPFKGY